MFSALFTCCCLAAVFVLINSFPNSPSKLFFKELNIKNLRYRTGWFEVPTPVRFRIMAERHLINQILESPQLRACIQSCINNNDVVGTGTPGPSRIRGSSRSMTEELRRLFPTIRPRPTSAQCSSSSLQWNKKKKIAKKPFTKEIILLKFTDTKTLTGFKKAQAYENGYALSAVEFEKSWGNEEIVNKIKESFEGKLNQQFEILIPMSGYLVKPALNNQEMNGFNLSKVFYNKPIYVRPCAEDYNVESESEDFPNYVSHFDEEVDVSGCNEHLHAEVAAKDGPNFEQATSLSEILQNLSKDLDEENTTYFNIYRGDIFNCCLRAIKRKSFSPSNKISVLFTDCENNSEEAIDAGGPKREMFRLILDYLGNHSQLFTGRAYLKTITMNKEELDKRNYFEAGRLIALAVVHVGLGPRFFSETFFALLTQGCHNIEFKVEDLPDMEIQNEIKLAIDAETLDALRAVIYEGTYIRLTGWETINDIEKKEHMIKDVLKFYIYDRLEKSLNQFIEGLNTLTVYEKVKRYPEYFIEMFCNTVEGTLTLSKMDSLFSIVYSEEGTNQRNAESRIIAFFKDFLIECSESDGEDENLCTMEQILMFVTGVNIIPPLGFSTKLIIKFLHEEDCPYPKGNTCALIFYLPVKHTDYENFKYNMSFGIKNGMVFGFA